MSVQEQAVVFGCDGAQLLGIASLPVMPTTPGTVGMVIIVGGPQYRAGSHRQFVHMARSAAAAGVPVLRFDVRGMGDSDGALRSFEHTAADIGAAIDALQAHAPTVQRVALWGLCDGASAALLYLDACGGDPRVAGLCMLNPWVRSETTLARTQVKHYYTQRLRQPEFWRKLLRGQVAGQALRGLLGNLRTAAGAAPTKDAVPSPTLPYTARMARQWTQFKGSLLLLLSGDDYTAKEFLEAWQSDPAWRGAAGHGRLQRVDLPAADHTLSDAASQHAMEQHCLRWLSLLAGDRAAGRSPQAATVVPAHAA